MHPNHHHPPPCPSLLSIESADPPEQMQAYGYDSVGMFCITRGGGNVSCGLGVEGIDWPQGLSMHNMNIFTCLWTTYVWESLQKCTNHHVALNLPLPKLLLLHLPFCTTQFTVITVANLPLEILSNI